MHSRTALLLSLLTVALGRPAAAQEEARSAWRRPDSIRAHLEAACEAVERAVGVRFRSRPTVVVSTQDEVARLRAGAAAGEEGLAESALDERRTYLAYYEPRRHRIHVLPEAATTLAESLGLPDVLDEDVLRVILVHEAAHALDFERHPLRHALACALDGDERLACQAVLEGHAQLIAEDVARQWGLEAAFERLTRVYAGACPREGDAGPPFDAEAAFTYLQGHAFLKSVRAAEGRRGVERVLAVPPVDTRVVDRPILWLKPLLREHEPDLKGVLEAFRPLVAGEDWEVRKWRVLGPPDCAFGSREPGGAEHFVERYVDNHALLAGPPDGSRYLSAFVALCASEAAAVALVRDLAQLDRGRDAERGWEPPVRQRGAGRGGRLPGFATERQAIGGGQPPRFSLQVARSGRYVVELAQYAVNGASREEHDEAMDLAVRMLEAPPAASAAVALRAHVLALMEARRRDAMDVAEVLVRDLLPTATDLMRVLRPEAREAFLKTYRGPRLDARTDRIPEATVRQAFSDLGETPRLLAWGATTGELANGRGHTLRFPHGMRAFARDVAAPGVVWLVLESPARGAERQRRYACFARVGDRFVWLGEPWRAGAR